MVVIVRKIAASYVAPRESDPPEAFLKLERQFLEQMDDLELSDARQCACQTGAMMLALIASTFALHHSFPQQNLTKTVGPISIMVSFTAFALDVAKLINVGQSVGIKKTFSKLNPKEAWENLYGIVHQMSQFPIIKEKSSLSQARFLFYSSLFKLFLERETMSPDAFSKELWNLKYKKNCFQEIYNNYLKQKK